MDPIYLYMVHSKDPSLGSQITLVLTPQGKIILVHCRHPWSCHPGSTLKWETSSCEDELCHHHQTTLHSSCTCFHYSGHKQTCYCPWGSQAHQVHWWLDQGIPRSVQRHWPIPLQIQNLTLSWCTSHVHAPRKCPITLHPKVKKHLDKMEHLGVIAPVDEPTDWVSSITYVQKANGELRLCLDPRDLKECHLPWSSLDANCGRSCSQVHTLPLLH